MQKLQDCSMVPNHTLRKLIDQWLIISDQNHGSTEVPHEKLISTMKINLQCPQSPFALRLETLGRIKAILAEADLRWRTCLIQSGFFPLLVEFIFGHVHLIENKEHVQWSVLIEEALDCVLILSECSGEAALKLIKERPNFSSLLNLFHHGNIKIKTRLCKLVGIISSSETNDLAIFLGHSQSIVKCLLCLLEQKTDPTACDAALTAISSLCKLESNRENVVLAGGVDGLVSYIENPDMRSTSTALSTLEVLAGLESGRGCLLSKPLLVHALVKMVFRVSDPQASEVAVRLLLLLCSESLSLRQEAIGAGVVSQLLLLLQSQCDGNTKDRTRALLKLLSCSTLYYQVGCS